MQIISEIPEKCFKLQIQTKEKILFTFLLQESGHVGVHSGTVPLSEIFITFF
jgi:hypothetical protein